MFNDFLFDRNAELVIGQRVAATNGPVEPMNARLYGKQENGNQFRISFKIEKNDQGKPNKASIQIWNLNEDSRSFLENKDMVVFLNAGYGKTLSNLFFGDIVRFNNKRDGADLVTVLECGDAEEILKNANVQIGFGPGVTNRELFKNAAEKLRVSVAYMEELPLKKFENGFSYSGAVSKMLDQLALQVGYKWSIQNGELLLLGPKKTDKTEAVYVSPQSGLIGDITKTKDGVEFISLLHPDIRPGRPVVVQSDKFMKGQGQTIKILKTVHEGDTHGDKWQVQGEGEII